MFETVLFPIDPSREALEFARRDGSRLVLLSVLQPVSEVKHDHEALAGVLSQTRKRCELAGVICQEVERSGKPASVICDVVDELNVDVIVMGTRGVNLESDSGSTAAQVLQLAPCPVLVVP